MEKSLDFLLGVWIPKVKEETKIISIGNKKHLTTHTFGFFFHVVMCRALKDWVPADPEPISSRAPSPGPLIKFEAQALKGLYFLLHKTSNFLGPSQKV